MSEVAALLKELQEELAEMKLLYKVLVEKLLPVEKPLEDEKESVEGSDETISGKEIMEALS